MRQFYQVLCQRQFFAGIHASDQFVCPKFHNTP